MPKEEQENQVLFQKNYDKETQHAIEEMIPEIIAGITKFYSQRRNPIINDPEMVSETTGNIMKVLEKCKQLYWKYHEDIRKNKDGTEEMTPLITYTVNNGITMWSTGNLGYIYAPSQPQGSRIIKHSSQVYKVACWSGLFLWKGQM